jgi:hypothetical protein
MENHRGMVSTGRAPDFSIRALVLVPAELSSSKAGETGKGNDKFLLTNYLFHTLKFSLTCRKIFRYVVDGFTFLPKEGVLRILKIHRPEPDLNPRTLGPVVSMLTTKTIDDDRSVIFTVC